MSIMKAYLVDEDTVTKLKKLHEALHEGTDSERDYGHKLWLIHREITNLNNMVVFNTETYEIEE